MKLIIEIPDEDYKFIKDLQNLIIGGRGNCKTIQRNVINAIKNGTTYDPKGKWIPVSERLPEDLEPVNITWINRKPAPYYKEIKDKPFTATGLYYNGQWFWWSSMCADILAEYGHCDIDMVDKDIEITHWQPLPEPYELQKARIEVDVMNKNGITSVEQLSELLKGGAK